MLTLYGTKNSGAAAIEAALQLTGAPFRWVEAASYRTETDQERAGLEELKRVNPLAQIPTLVLDDGTVMTESAAILIHLGLQYPASGLLPEDPAARARALRGLVYITANCYAAVGILDYPERWYSNEDEATSERVRAGTGARLMQLWETFADQFPATPYLTGAQLGALDLLVAVVSRWSGARKHLATARPAFHALLTRIDVEPRVAHVFARHWPSKN
jgi:GST-like protein